MNTRYPFIDIAKGLGIVLVVCSHVCPPLMRWALPCYIPLFFLTSGYCTTRAVSLTAKARTLLLPYLFFSVLLIVVHRSFGTTDIIGAVYSRYSLYPMGTPDNIFFMSLQTGNAPLWFLTAMFISFVWLWLAQRFPKWELPLMGIYFFLAWLLCRLPILLPWSIETAFFLTLFIEAGMLLRRYNLLQRMGAVAFACIVLVYIPLCWASDGVNLSVREYGPSLLLLLPTALAGSVGLMQLSQYLTPTILGKLLKHTGRQSLPIFCIHLPFIHQFDTLLVKLQWSPVQVPLLRGAVIVLLVLCITWPIAFVLNKYVISFLTGRRRTS